MPTCSGGAKLEGPYGIPLMEPVQYLPTEMAPFSQSVGRRAPDRSRCCVHCFEDDWKFERLWNRPQRYLPRILGFEAFVAPDYSTYVDFPPALCIYNTYRNYLLGSWLQRQGAIVLPNVRLCGPLSLSYALAGVPEGSVLAVGSHGCIKDRENRARFVRELRALVDLKRPTGLVVYGSDAYGTFDYPRECGIPVRVFPSRTGQAHGGETHGEGR